MVLADALTHAERRGLVVRNVGKLSVMPKTAAVQERESYTVEQVRRLFKAAKGERLEALVVVGLSVGLRPGELTAPLWDDVALDADPATLSITGSIKRRPDGSLYRGPVKKSTAGDRTIALPAVAVEALKAHQIRQDEERRAAGEAWDDQGLVFTTAIGTPLDPSNVRKMFTKVVNRAGLAGFPYLLRHTVVSLLLDNGATIEEVADLLGDDPQTLYRHYRHRVRPVVDVAARRMHAVLAPE